MIVEYANFSNACSLTLNKFYLKGYCVNKCTIITHWHENIKILIIIIQTIHDEFQALQLAYTQLEERQKESHATISVLRQELTKKIEKKCDALDEEVKNHEKFVI